MDRKRKYHTDKERREAQRKWQMEHYLRNKEEIKQKARDKYREQKRNQEHMLVVVVHKMTQTECSKIEKLKVVTYTRR